MTPLCACVSLRRHCRLLTRLDTPVSHSQNRTGKVIKSKRCVPSCYGIRPLLEKSVNETALRAFQYILTLQNKINGIDSRTLKTLKAPIKNKRDERSMDQSIHELSLAPATGQTPVPLSIKRGLYGSESDTSFPAIVSANRQWSHKTPSPLDAVLSAEC